MIVNTIVTLTNTASIWSWQETYTQTMTLSDGTDYYTVSANGIMSNSRTDYAAGLATTGYFVPVAGKRYKVTYKVKKLGGGTGLVGDSWLRPGFVSWQSANASVDIFGSTFGQGLWGQGGVIDTSTWIVGKEYEIGAIASWNTPLPILARPRIRVNRNGTDTAPYSNATYLITSAKFDPEVKFSELRDEFSDSAPITLSDYHRKDQVVSGQAYIVDTNFDYNYVVNSVVPVTESQANIFNTWFSFNGINIVSNTTDWTYNAVTESIVSTVNSVLPIGYVSPNSYDYYTHQAIISSNNADDDVIGLVVAANSNAISNTISNLLLWRSQGGNGVRWGLVSYLNGTVSPIIDQSSTVPDYFVNNANSIHYGNGWQQYGNSTVKVIRNGSTIKAWTSQYGNSIIDDSTLIQYTIPDGTTFSGARPYGYFSYSQLNATFSAIQFAGGLQDYIYDNRTGTYQVWQYNAISNSWVVNSSVTTESLGHPRILVNPVTKKVFELRAGNEYVASLSNNINVPTTGAISLSNFYGTLQQPLPVFANAAGSLGSVTHAVPFNITVVATTTNDTIHYSMANAPAGTSIGANTGIISGTIASAGTYTFDVYAYGTFKVASRTFTITAT